MRYYKVITDNYIVRIGTGKGGQEISSQEYENILGMINRKPEPTDTTGYRLRADLTWEAYEKEPIEPVEEEASADEILAILTGESE